MTATRPIPAPLAGQFIRLEPLRLDHLPALFEAIGKPITFGGGPAGYRDTPPAFAEWAEHYYRWNENAYAAFIVGGANDSRLVGTSTIGEFVPAQESAHIGWTAWDQRVWGTAVNPEAKLLMLGLAFDHGFGRVQIQADALNSRSRSAIVGIGATFEGILRRDMHRADGSWRDTAVYSVTIDDWPDVRAGLQRRLASYDGQPVVLR